MGAWQNFLTRVRRAVRAFESERLDDESRWSFEVRLEADELDGGWVATCPAFPGAAAQGETQKEALDALSTVLVDIIETRMDEQLTGKAVDDTTPRSYRVALTG